jgi:hypothetical protein
MEEIGETIRILFLDGQERTFANASLDTSTAGWLSITRLELQAAPLSGIAKPIAGYRLEALKGWEYVGGEGKDTAIDTSVSG